MILYNSLYAKQASTYLFSDFFIKRLFSFLNGSLDLSTAAEQDKNLYKILIQKETEDYNLWTFRVKVRL